MKAADLNALIKECVQEVIDEEFGDEGWMQAVNIAERENENLNVKD
jgi:hypothetical protein